MSSPSVRANSSPRLPQFRLATLLILIAYAALICLGFRSPTPLWAGIVSVLTLLTIFSAILIAIYHPGPPRVMAIGYLLFCIGYMVHLTVLANLLSARLDNGTTTLWSPFSDLYQTIHKQIPGSRPVGNPNARGNFLSIGHHALATFFGLLGSLLAQYLYATQPREQSTSPDA